MDENLKKFHKLESLACVARGHIIHRTANFEMSINIFLANHFAKDKQTGNELLSSLLCTNRITFMAKVEVFWQVVESHHPKFIKAKPKYKTEMKEIAEIRNQFAHLCIDVTESGLQKTGVVALAKWKKGDVHIKNYTLAHVNIIVDRIYDYTDEISKLDE